MDKVHRGHREMIGDHREEIKIKDWNTDWIRFTEATE
jgi:hypothetical protein